MEKFKVIKQIDFGNFTIEGPTGLQSDQVQINTYAPKVDDIVEGDLVTKPIPDGNGHEVTMTGIVYPIKTNGEKSTSAQTVITFIPQDYLEPYTEPVVSPPSPVDGTPCTNSVGNTTVDGTYKNGVCISTAHPLGSKENDNSTRNIILVVLIAVVLIIFFNN